MTTTATTSGSTVIGVFSDSEQTNNAIDELRRANFGYERIRLVGRGTGGFLDTLKGMMTGQAEMTSSSADDLAKMGMPDYEAQYYQRELDGDHVLLLMNADDRPEEAFAILRQNGAFDIASRLRLNPEDSSAGTDGVDQSAVMQNSNGSRPAPQPDEPPMATPPDVAVPLDEPPMTAPPDMAAPEPDDSQDTDTPDDSQNTDTPDESQGTPEPDVESAT